MSRSFRRTRQGAFEVRLGPVERDILRSLPPQLRDVLVGEEDPALERLFPSAYPDDPGREGEYRRLVHDQLLAARLDAIDTLESTVDADRLDEEQLLTWMRVVNDLRLLLGTRLEVTEDPSERELPPTDPRRPAFELYGWLSWLEQEMVEAVTD